MKKSTLLMFVLMGENYSINHKIDYMSVELKDMKESSLEGAALEEL